MSANAPPEDEDAPVAGDKAAEDAKAADELAVLFPDIDVVVRDPDSGAPVTLTLREFRFREGLEAQAVARPLIQALTRLADEAGADGAAAIDVATIEAAIGGHPDAWLDLIGIAAGRDTGWLSRLADADARAVSHAMWNANTLFFVRRLVAGAMDNAATAHLFRSLASWMRSSAPDTAPDTSSSAIN